MKLCVHFNILKLCIVIFVYLYIYIELTSWELISWEVDQVDLVGVDLMGVDLVGVDLVGGHRCNERLRANKLSSLQLFIFISLTEALMVLAAHE